MVVFPVPLHPSTQLGSLLTLPSQQLLPSDSFPAFVLWASQLLKTLFSWLLWRLSLLFSYAPWFTPCQICWLLFLLNVGVLIFYDSVFPLVMPSIPALQLSPRQWSISSTQTSFPSSRPSDSQVGVILSLGGHRALSRGICLVTNGRHVTCF